MAGLDMTAEECLSAGYVCLRVRNSSTFDFGRFNVHFPNHTESFGSIGSGEISAYRRTGYAYRYAYTEAFAGFGKFVLLPNDYVGESYLAPGVYTYEYSAEAHVKFTFGWLLGGTMGVELNYDEDDN